MWSELAQLVAKRGGSALPTGAEARAMLALAGALAHCEIAFEHVESQNTQHMALPGLADLDAALAMDSMLATLHNVQPILELLHPERADVLKSYLLGSPGTRTAESARDRLRRAVQLMRHLLALEAAAAPALFACDDFSHARRKIGALIFDRYSAEQIWVA